MWYNIYIKGMGNTSHPTGVIMTTTTFTKSNLTVSRGYITYSPIEGGSKFVARFKLGSPGSFMTILRKKFTVEEYFARLDAGETPHHIAESKGYISPHVKRWMKEGGFPITPAGKVLFAAAQRAAADRAVEEYDARKAARLAAAAA
jgi:hypothetical protein